MIDVGQVCGVLRKGFVVSALCLSVCAGAFALPERWAAQDEADALNKRFLEFFDGAEMRLPGSDGNLLIEKRVSEIFENSGLEHGSIEFAAPAFRPGEASLSLPSGVSVKMRPMHPSLFRPGNFSESSFDAKLVYLGDGSNRDFERAKGLDLDGAVVVMEFGASWMRFLRFGVRGFVFLGGDLMTHKDAVAKVYNTETSIPRFFVDASDAGVLREMLTSGPVSAGVRAEPSLWDRQLLRNLWVFIPGSDPNLSKEVSVLMAPMDSNCVVPELAQGAQSAANLFVMMQLFERYKAQPPARSTLVVAVNAHTQRFLGERMLAWHLFGDVESIRNILHTDIRMSQVYLDFYSKLDLTEYNEDAEELLIDLRSAMDSTTALNILIKTPLVTRSKGDMNSRKMDILALQREESSMDTDEYKKQLARLEHERDEFVNVLTLFNRVGIQTVLSDLNEREFEILRSYVAELIETHTRYLDLNTASLERDVSNSAVRNVLQGRRVRFALEMDMDFTSTKLGFSVGGSEQHYGQWAVRWGHNMMRIASALEPVRENLKKNLLEDTLTMQGGITELFFFRDTGVLRSGRDCFYASGGRPAFSIRNVFSSRGRAFLPTDTFDNIDAGIFAESMFFLGDFLSVVLNDPSVTLQSELPSAAHNILAPLWSTVVRTMKFDEMASSSVVPDVPVANTAVILSSPGMPDSGLIVNGDVCGGYTALADERGVVVFYGLLDRALDSQALQFNSDFTKVKHAIDAGDRQQKVNSNLAAGQDDKVLPMFKCVEFSLPMMYDSSQIPAPLPVGSVIPLSSIGDSPPRVYGMCGLESVVSTKRIPGRGVPSASVFLKDTERIKLVTNAKRLLLNASKEAPEGIGYSDSSQVGHDVFAQVARDMAILNQARIERLRDVANELAVYFLQRGNKAIENMDAALVEGDHIAYLRYLYEAVGAQVKSYNQSKATIDDMLKAVVVYMALLLPFCFFVQKLVFNFVKIESQMAAFAGLFLVTFVVFRLIHPAFRVAQAAEAIFVAFVMGSLGLFVISILRSRFETEMQLLFRSFSIASNDEVDYSTVGQKAMLIGVNNMKRRRMRTTLTTATIVLVAFTMLSFTSISKRVNPTIIARGKSVPYTGFMYHLPGLTFIDEHTVGVMDTMFHNKGLAVLRRWLTSEHAPFGLECSNGERVIVDAVLGLSVAEDGFIDRMPLIAGSFFSSDNAAEAVIAASLAETIGVDPDRLEDFSLFFQGTELKLSGIVDDAMFRMLRDMNGAPIVPIERVATDTGTMSSQQELESMMSARVGAEEGEGIYLYTDLASLLIMPVDTAKRFGAQPYSLSVKLAPDEPVWPLMDALLTATHARFYVGSLGPFAADDVGENKISAGIYYVGSNYRTVIGGIAVLLIPLLITSTIILNTMLGSVYERKKEIAVYNAVGLNPHHIGMFFLAESFVYGVIGAVGGYLIGQVLSILINALGVVEGINLNYSSMSVAYVIVFTIAVVVLSTIYPAVVATKAAVPSGKRKWSLPAHDGNRMEVLFPFIYHPRLATGIIGYLREYFGSFTEASFGDLIAEEQDHSVSVDADNNQVYSFKYHITLAPFDLGVTQDLDFKLAYNSAVQAYQLNMIVTRVSGQDSNWATTNKPFLERMRKYLMRWRNIDVSRHMLYVKQAEQFFGENQDV